MSAEQMSANSEIDLPLWFLRFIGVCEVAGALGLVPLDEEDVVGQLVEDPVGHRLERALVDPHRAVVAAADVQAEGHVGGEALDHAAVELDDAEIGARLAAWVPRVSEVGGGFARYRALVGPASEGAVLRDTMTP